MELIINKDTINSDVSYASVVTILTQGRVNRIDIIYPIENESDVVKCIESSLVMKYGNRTMKTLVVSSKVSVICLRKMDILFDTMAIEDEFKKIGVKYVNRQIIYQGK